MNFAVAVNTVDYLKFGNFDMAFVQKLINLLLIYLDYFDNQTQIDKLLMEVEHLLLNLHFD